MPIVMDNAATPPRRRPVNGQPLSGKKLMKWPGCQRKHYSPAGSSGTNGAACLIRCEKVYVVDEMAREGEHKVILLTLMKRRFYL